MSACLGARSELHMPVLGAVQRKLNHYANAAFLARL